MSLIEQYTKEELEQIVMQSTNMSEVTLKLGYATRSGNNYLTVKKKLDELGIDYSHFTTVSRKVTKRTAENVFIENSTASQHVLRNWYKKGEYTPYVCAICGQEPEWQGQPLTLILDHINGQNKDNRLENLRWVCPNCNQQLDTTGFKKMRVESKPVKKFYCIDCGTEILSSSTRCPTCAAKQRRISDRPTREELKQMIRTQSFVSIASNFGVSDNAIRKWCDSYHLPKRKKDISSYSNEQWALI